MLAKITIGLFFLLLVWGNIVAGLKVGLACPDWPLCYGKVVPPFRWDIYIEFSHRVLGGIAGISLVILAVKRLKIYTGNLKSIPVIAIVLLAIQVVMGGLVVLMKLPVNLTTFHFSTAIVIFTLVIFLAHYDGVNEKPEFGSNSFSSTFFLLTVLILGQAMLGAYVRHSEAGLACPDFPKCLGFWIPPSLSGAVLIHYLHRSVAYLIFFIFLALFVYSNFNTSLSNYTKKIGIIFGLIIIQILLGMGIIHSKLFFVITALHIFVALLILYVLISVWYSENTKSVV